MPGFLLARFAVDEKVAGQRLGGQLLLAAALRCLRGTEAVGGAHWYAGFGTALLTDRPLTLVGPLTSFAAALRESGISEPGQAGAVLEIPANPHAAELGRGAPRLSFGCSDRLGGRLYHKSASRPIRQDYRAKERCRGDGGLPGILRS